MNLYFWLILFTSVIFLAFGCYRGFHIGFVKELEGLVAWICAAAALVLISSLARGAMGERVSSKALALALLIVLALVYSLCRIIFTSLKLFAGLPVIRFLDSVLGIAAGAGKSFLLLYIVEQIARIWLNL